MSDTPSPTGDNGGGSGRNGRDSSGRFAGGNTYGRGNPHHAAVAQLRAQLLEAVTPDDLRAIVEALIRKAKGGDVVAAREILDRVLGKPTQAIELGGGDWIDISTPAGREAYAASVRMLYGIGSPPEIETPNS